MGHRGKYQNRYTCGGLRNDPAAIQGGADPTVRENVVAAVDDDDDDPRGRRAAAAISGRRSPYHRVAPPLRRGLRPWIIASPAGIGIAGVNGGLADLARPGPAVRASV